MIKSAASALLLALAATGSARAAATPSSSSSSSSPSSGPQVNLGYAIYEGSYSSTYDLNIWKSVRYAAPPVGNLRWQAPQDPPSSGSSVIQATAQPPLCPQSGAYGTPSRYGFNSGPGNEDCLYLNVYAPPGAKDLPVFVWIHGGGYSDFGAVYDPSVLMNTNNNSFITVEMQYRLGAFGYLASPDVQQHGALNAGLLDQRFALEWVQQHIASFGGDASRVTLGGESSGAGSVMYQSLAYGGEESSLFNNIILASPYVPAVYPYDDAVPTGNYAAFAQLAGCGNGSSALSHYSNVFDCLIAADTAALQNASGLVSTTIGSFGSFSWLPVVDGDLIQDRPSVLLKNGQVSGKRLLVGTNANEGVPLTNPNVSTKAQFDSFVSETFPLFSETDVFALNIVYDTARAQSSDNATRFDTTGVSWPTANTVSGMATGIQQTTFNIAAESIFQCPALWLAEAFGYAGQAWKYQYSTDPAFHGADLSAYWSVGATTPSAGFRHAFQKIWGGFIVNDSPVIAVADATAGAANATVPVDHRSPGQIVWPQFTANVPTFMNLNATGGEVSLVTVTDELSYYVRSGAGIVNTFSLADAMLWEGGRGIRCESFWRAVASRVPN